MSRHLCENPFLYNPNGLHFTLAELRSLPTIRSSQTDDLKAEPCPTMRVWLSRCGVDDGEICENKVTVEDLRGGRWTVRCTYEAT